MKRIIQTLILSVLCTVTFARINTVLVDFGSNSSPLPWNNLSNFNNGSISNLRNTFGVTTDISLSVIDSFTGINSSGTTMPSKQTGCNQQLNLQSFSQLGMQRKWQQ